MNHTNFPSIRSDTIPRIRYPQNIRKNISAIFYCHDIQATIFSHSLPFSHVMSKFPKCPIKNRRKPRASTSISLPQALWYAQLIYDSYLTHINVSHFLLQLISNAKNLFPQTKICIPATDQTSSKMLNSPHHLLHGITGERFHIWWWLPSSAFQLQCAKKKVSWQNQGNIL